LHCLFNKIIENKIQKKTNKIKQTSRHKLKTSSIAGRRYFAAFSAISINALRTVSSSELAKLCVIV
jgi:hypothetical protein